jgi:catechol 2,3-dioxygenase-like lactoylglutathione lyase family enzyme
MAQIKHIAIYSDDPQKAANFYCQAFDLKVVTVGKAGSVIISDGYVCVSLLKARDSLKGLHHFGFLVESCELAQQRLNQVCGDDESHKPPKAVVAEFRVHDPDGVPLDVSEREWGDPRYSD